MNIMTVVYVVVYDWYWREANQILHENVHRFLFATPRRCCFLHAVAVAVAVDIVVALDLVEVALVVVVVVAVDQGGSKSLD